MPKGTIKYTNVVETPVMPTVPSIKVKRLAPPRIARSKGQALTEREKIARQIARTTKTADFGGPEAIGNNSVLAGGSSFFSPQLSTDFLELPQSLREKREIYRHYYNTDPIVGQAIDLHTELPLSKIRLGTPKPRTCPKGFTSPESYGRYIFWYFNKMCQKIKLFQRLVTGVHHYWLDGLCAVFAEDSDVDIPQEVGYEKKQIGTESIVDENGNTVEQPEYAWVERADREEQELAYYQKHYQGWERLVCLPMDQVKMTSYSFTDKMRVELIPSERDRALLEQAKQGNDPIAIEMAEEIPGEVAEYISGGRLIPLSTDPDEGSFVYLLSNKKGAGEEMGQSILDRCLRVLTQREKLRQAQASISSRNMTPKRLVWADRVSEIDVDDLREQVDMALVDPDYSIVTNYEVHWEEIGSKDRLLDLAGEYEVQDRYLRTGLGVTEALLSGESLYSGDRLKLEVINTRYLFLREVIQEYVEEYLFKPVARRKGFIEKNEWGEEEVIFPRLSFTRLPLRDSQDTYDALFNLYQKGSISIDLILEMFNIDPDDTRIKIEKDLFTVNDATFNELVRGVNSAMAQKLVDETDIAEKITQYLKLKPKAQPPAEEESRF